MSASLSTERRDESEAVARVKRTWRVAQLLELADWMESHPLRVLLSGSKRQEWEFDPYPMTPKELRDAAEMLEAGIRTMEVTYDAE